MSSTNRRIFVPDKERGGWKAVEPEAGGASTVVLTDSETIDTAELVQQSPGGEIQIRIRFTR